MGTDTITNVDEKLVFKSEEERENALLALPDEPPTGTADVDAWIDEIHQKEEKSHDNRSRSCRNGNCKSSSIARA